MIVASDEQHAYLHARLNEGSDAGDHTHVHADGTRTRHTVKTQP